MNRFNVEYYLAAYESGHNRISSSTAIAADIINKSPLAKLTNTVAFNHLYISPTYDSFILN